MKAKFIYESLSKLGDILNLKDLAQITSRTQREEEQETSKKIFLNIYRDAFKKEGDYGVKKLFKEATELNLKTIAKGRYVIVYENKNENMKLVKENLIEPAYECPHCGNILDTEELDQVYDEGCPYCRAWFDPSEVENLNEVLRDEDEWANREIDRFHGKDVKEPVEKDFDWKDIIPDDEVDPDNMGYSEEEYKEALGRVEAEGLESKEEQDRKQLISHIGFLEEAIWERGNPQQKDEWMNYMKGINLESLDVETLEVVFMNASVIVNSLKPKS